MTVVPPPSQRRRTSALTKQARELFLESIASGWSITHAAKRAGVHKQRLYELRNEDEAFAGEWEAALEQGTQVLEDELNRRAVEGWDEDVYDGKGNLVRRVRRYSPALLIFSLKARRPEVYRDQVQRVEVTGAGGGPVELDAGYRPTTLTDVLALATELGVLPSGIGEVVDGEAVEVPELDEGRP